MVCVGDTKGWALELAGKALDDRRSDAVLGPFAAKEAVDVAIERLASRADAETGAGCA